MNKSKLLLLAAAIASQCLFLPSARAQVYDAFLTAVSVTTNSHGGLSYTRFSSRDLVVQCAHEAGLSNVSGLRLVYDLTADALEVVHGTNHTLVCTPITFSGGLTLSKTNNKVQQRLAFLTLENSAAPNGTMQATEFFRFGTNNQITKFSLFGELQFADTGTGTNASKIYRGDLFAGSFFDGFER